MLVLNRVKGEYVVPQLICAYDTTHSVPWKEDGGNLHETGIDNLNQVCYRRTRQWAGARSTTLKDGI